MTTHTPLFPRIREPRRKKTPIEEHWEKYGSFGLTSVEQETHEKYFYGTEHWNYFTNDEDLGPVILSMKQENINGRDQFRYQKFYLNVKQQQQRLWISVTRKNCQMSINVPVSPVSLTAPTCDFRSQFKRRFLVANWKKYPCQFH